MGWRAGLGRASLRSIHSFRELSPRRCRASGIQGRSKSGCAVIMRASPDCTGRAGAEPSGEDARGGAAGRIFRSPCAVPGVPRGDSGRPAVHTCLFLPERHVSFTHRPLASGRSRGGWLPERGGSVFLWQFSPRCGILPHCFSRGGGALSPPFPCLSAERRNSGVK